MPLVAFFGNGYNLAADRRAAALRVSLRHDLDREDSAVDPKTSQVRMMWLSVGVAAGLCIAYFWPHEPALAGTADRGEKFAMLTVAAADQTIGGVRNTMEGVFVLDFVTRRITGRVLGRNGKFNHEYYRNLNDDFGLDESVEPQFAFVTGNSQLTFGGRASLATGVIYVGEMTTGKVIAYGFYFNESNRQLPPEKLGFIRGFQFREGTGDE